jgi:hypothetical protein
MESAPHFLKRRGPIEPDFKRQRALVQKHRQPVRAASARRRSVLK